MSLLISFVAFLLFGLLLFWFLPRYSAQIDEDDRCSPQSKYFKIDDPVVYNDHGDDFFTYINGVYSGEEVHNKLCYSLESVEFVVWSSKLRHPTKEELQKYFK